MIQKQNVYVNEKAQTIRSLQEVSGGIPIGEEKFVADFVITVDVGGVPMQLAVPQELEGPTPEDAFASIPAAHKLAIPRAEAAAKQQLEHMRAQAEAEARRIVRPGEAAQFNGTNGHAHGLRIRN